MVELDSEMAIEMLSGFGSSSHELQHLVRGTLDVGGGELKTNWKKISCDINTVVDQPVRRSHISRDICVIFDTLPDFLASGLTLESGLMVI